MVSKAAIALPIAVGAAGVSLYAFYAYSRRNKTKDEDETFSMEGWTEHRMVLNKAYAHVVLGQLEFIGQTSNTLVKVQKSAADDDTTFSIVMKGTSESVQEAEFMVNRLIENSPEITKSVLEVPKDKIKLFVGDFGENLLRISQETGSKLFLKCDPDYFEVSPFYIEIQGPREKNSLAYNLIRQALGNEIPADPSRTNRWDELPKENPIDLLNASVDSKYVGVTVSAILSISQFWIQLHQLNSTLDKMERRIADHFSQVESPSVKVTKPKIGLMVAVPYTKQGKWHRATIVELEAQNNESYSVRAKFVDYGDIEDIKLEEVRVLPEEFVHYPHFAVECCLHGVLPRSLKPGGIEEWTEESLDFFESLTSDRPNKIFMAKKFSDVEVTLSDMDPIKGRKVKRLLPSIDLVDTNSSEDINISLELVSKGFAVWSAVTSQKPQFPEKPLVLPESDDNASDELEMAH